MSTHNNMIVMLETSLILLSSVRKIHNIKVSVVVYCLYPIRYTSNGKCMWENVSASQCLFLAWAWYVCALSRHHIHHITGTEVNDKKTNKMISNSYTNFIYRSKASFSDFLASKSMIFRPYIMWKGPPWMPRKVLFGLYINNLCNKLDELHDSNIWTHNLRRSARANISELHGTQPSDSHLFSLRMKPFNWMKVLNNTSNQSPGILCFLYAPL